MSYTPLKVRYGTAVEPWHSLSLFYHYDTPMPRQRDRTRSSRALSGLTPHAMEAEVRAMFIGIGLLTVAGIAAYRYGRRST